MGTSNDAQEHSTKTHRLPIPPGAKGETSYYDIFYKILDFLDEKQSRMEFPVFFTNSDEIKETKMILDKISRECEELELDIQVYPIENLFYPLKRYTTQLKNELNGTNDKHFPSIYVAKDMIDRDKYRYSLNLGCNFHDMEDCPTFCSLSKVKRWAYVISDHCVNDLRLKFIPGRHMPGNYEADLAPLTTSKPKFEDAYDEDEKYFKNKENARAQSPILNAWNKNDRKPWNFIDDDVSSSKYTGTFQNSDFPTLGESRSVSEHSQFSRQNDLSRSTMRPSDTSFVSTSMGRGMLGYTGHAMVPPTIGRGRGLSQIHKYN